MWLARYASRPPPWTVRVVAQPVPDGVEQWDGQLDRIGGVNDGFGGVGRHPVGSESMNQVDCSQAWPTSVEAVINSKPEPPGAVGGNPDRQIRSR